MFRLATNSRISTLLLLLFGMAMLGTIPSPALAAACSGGSRPGMPPPTYGYHDSFITLSGFTKICWTGENYAHKIKSYGAGCCPSTPLDRIRAKTTYWEEIDGGICNNVRWDDTGWKLNVYAAKKTTPYIHWECTGTGSHSYVARTTHFFGGSFTAETAHY